VDRKQWENRMSDDIEVLVVHHDGEPDLDRCEILDCPERWTVIVVGSLRDRRWFHRHCDDHHAETFAGLQRIGDWTLSTMPRAMFERLEADRSDETLATLDATLGRADYVEFLRAHLAAARKTLRHADERHDVGGCVRYQREVDFFYQELVRLCETP
jgi:hypothetical protein